MLTAWGDSTEDDEASKEEEVVVALMVRSESNSDDEPLESLAQLKEKLHGHNKAQLKGLLFTLMDDSNGCLLYTSDAADE